MVLLITFLFIAVIARLIYIEVVTGEELQARALEQWYRDVPLRAERGEITDRNGVVLAASVTAYTIYARPVAVTNKELTAAVLSETLELKYDAVLSKINSRSSEVTVKHGVDKETVLKIAESGATGIYVSENISRVYPYGNLLTQVMGFTNSDVVGQTGVEAYYNSYLEGKDGYVLTEADLVGREIEDGVTYYVPGTAGTTVKLTIDYNVQSFVENIIAKAKETHNAKGVSCAVMNAKTGEIIAMAENPSFDLNDVPRDDVKELLETSRCKLISDVFEPGSTFKILTAAIGLDTQAITTDYRCYCGGSLTVDGQRIKCWRTIGHGSQTFAEGVQNSCNCMFMNIAMNVGVSAFYDGLAKLGVTSKTGIDMSGEASGLTIAESAVKTVDLARIGFGQAIAMTPIELLRAAAAVVNGGDLVTPYVTESVTAADGTVLYKAQPQIVTGVVKESTSRVMREVLESVVLVGSGKNAQVTGIRIGGKTGTAQKYENGAIARGKYVSTFIGFAPADDPEYISLIVVDEPVGAYYGGIVAAPYVGEIFKNLYQYKS